MNLGPRFVAIASVAAALLAACASSDDRPAAAVDRIPTTDGGVRGGGGADASVDASPPTDDKMVLVPANGNLKAFYIDSYEASLVGRNAISKPQVAPAVNIDFAGATAACASAGKRLCTHNEWRAACRGPSDLLFGFQSDDTNLVSICDVARTTNNTPGSLPSNTLAHPNCKTKGYDVWDMIGNLTEWATDDATGTALAAGAAFYQETSGSNCDATLNKPGTTTPMPATEKATDIGFRCCRSQ